MLMSAVCGSLAIWSSTPVTVKVTDCPTVLLPIRETEAGTVKDGPAEVRLVTLRGKVMVVVAGIATVVVSVIVTVPASSTTMSEFGLTAMGFGAQVTSLEGFPIKHPA